VVFVGPASSDVHSLCLESACAFYRQVDPGDPAAFAAAIEQLADWSEMTSSVARDRFDPTPRLVESGEIEVDAIFD
jgi:hypothetical protein